MREISGSGHDVEMDVREALGLSELRNIGLHAARHSLQRLRQAYLPGPEGSGFCVAQLGYRCHVSAREKHQPARQRRVESVRHPPELIDSDTLSQRQLVNVGIAVAAVAVGLLLHVPNTSLGAACSAPHES